MVSSICRCASIIVVAILCGGLALSACDVGTDGSGSGRSAREVEVDCLDVAVAPLRGLMVSRAHLREVRRIFDECWGSRAEMGEAADAMAEAQSGNSRFGWP